MLLEKSMSLANIKTNRNLSIELLRIFLTCGVIILHYVSNPGNLLENVSRGNSIYYFIVLFNSISVCAVDTFIIISGYYSCKKNSISIRKIVQLFTEIIVIQIIFSVIIPILRGGEISLRSLIYSFLPKNYYVTLYAVLMLLSPFLNYFIRHMPQRVYSKLLTVVSLVFLVEPTIADIIEGIMGKTIYGISTIGILGSQWGYTIVTFVCLYLIAAYVRLYGSLWGKKTNLILYFVSTIILYVWKLVEINVGFSISAEHYQNPIVVLNALSLFLVFNELQIRNRTINLISKGCFTVYLLHARLINHFDMLEYLNENLFMFLGVCIFRLPNTTCTNKLSHRHDR